MPWLCPLRLDSFSFEEVQAHLEVLSIKKAGNAMPCPFHLWDWSENSLLYPFPCFHEVCGNFTSLQPHSLSSIWLKFPDWHRNYKGGREAQSLGAFHSLETSGRENPSRIFVCRSFSSLKGSKVGSGSAFVSKIKDAQPYHTEEGNSLISPSVLNLKRNPKESHPN